MLRQRRSRPPRRDSDLVVLTVAISALMMVGTVQSFVFGSLGPLLVADFSLSRAQFGMLTTMLFAIAAALSPALGYSTDRLKVRTVYSVLFGTAAVSLAGLALSPTYVVLISFAGLAGVSQALANPLSNKLVADNIPQRRQGLVMGVKQSAVPMGGVLAGVSLPWLAVLIGWRAALVGTAFLVVVVWIASIAQIPERQLPTEVSTLTSGIIDPLIVMLSGYAFLMGSAMASVQNYLPLYAYETLGLPPAVAGNLVGVLAAVGVVSRILVGHAVDRVGDVTRLLNGLATIATVAVAVILLAQVVGAGFLWLGAFLFGWSVAWNAVVMIAVVKVAERRTTGRASSSVMVGFFGGFIVAPLVFGAAVDFTGGYTIPWSTVTLLLLATSLALYMWRRRAGHTHRRGPTPWPNQPRT